MRNAGLLFTGKGAAGLMQLATFALAARALGLVDFGLFSMLTAQVMLIAGLAAFESNQAIVRYGVEHLNSGDAHRFQSLIKAGTLLDVGAAAVAAVTIVAAAPLIGRLAGWNDTVIDYARWLAPLTFANIVATPKGMLRLFGRFDLLTAHALVTPAARFAGVAAAWAVDARLPVFLAIWIAAGWLGAAVGLFFGWREAHRRELLAGFHPRLRNLTADSPGLWRFTLASNLHSSVALVPTHASTFIVGALLGPAAAGLFRVAREIGTALAKPTDLVNQALFPDVARMVAAGEWQRVSRTAIRAGAAAAAVGAALTLIAWLAGERALAAIFGPAYGAAAVVLVMMAGSTAVRVSALAADPIMYALGRPGVPLLVALIANGVFIGVLIWKVEADGLSGAGWAFAAAAITGATLSALFARRMLEERSAAEA